MPIDKVFVYGTLMHGMSNHHLVQPYIKSVMPASMKGVLYDLPFGYPAVAEGNGVVWGEILELNDIVHALPILDELEEYHGPDAHNNEYVRVVREAEYNGERQSVFVYLWAMPAQLDEIGVLLAGGEWKASRGKMAQEGGT